MHMFTRILRLELPLGEDGPLVASIAPDVRLSNCFQFLEKVYGRSHPEALTSSLPKASVTESSQLQQTIRR